MAKVPKEEQAQSSRSRPLNRMSWQGISPRTYPSAMSPVAPTNFTRIGDLTFAENGIAKPSSVGGGRSSAH
jgi:hypothetical protein